MVTEKERAATNQRCPACGTDPGFCDWCASCDIWLQCAQTEPGFAAAELRYEDGVPVLYLARATESPYQWIEDAIADGQPS
jgi:hypothetical protein